MPLTAFSMARPGCLTCMSLNLVHRCRQGSQVTVVHLVVGLGAGDADLVGVDDDDEVTGIDVRRRWFCACCANGGQLRWQLRPSTLSVASITNRSCFRFGRFGAEGLERPQRSRNIAGRRPIYCGSSAPFGLAAKQMQDDSGHAQARFQPTHAFRPGWQLGRRPGVHGAAVHLGANPGAELAPQGDGQPPSAGIGQP